MLRRVGWDEPPGVVPADGEMGDLLGGCGLFVLVTVRVAVVRYRGGRGGENECREQGEDALGCSLVNLHLGSFLRRVGGRVMPKG